jgi:DNA repair protein RecO (recombination protein O)
MKSEEFASGVQTFNFFLLSRTGYSSFFVLHSSFLFVTFAHMLVKTEAIVLHALKYGETRLIVDLFTKEAGRLSCIIPLPKTPKSRLKRQYFQPMTLLEVELDLRPRLQLQKLKDARLLSAYASIPFSPEKLAISLFIAEFLYYALRTQQQDEPLFLYLRDSMQWLDIAEKGYANFHLTFLMRMSRFLGFYPNLEVRGEKPEVRGELFDLREGRFCTAVPTHRDFLPPAEAGLIRLLMRMDFATMHLFLLSRHDRNRITDVLLQYYRLHIPQFPELKSLGVLQELWADE